MNSERRIAVVGLGYVGLPVALAFARKFAGTIGFDVDPDRVRALSDGHDATAGASASELREAQVQWTSDPQALRVADFYVVAVPTPVDGNRCPDLSALMAATDTIAGALAAGDIVVYESTVYPGLTEQRCGRRLEAGSGLRSGVDFKLGYSPERINPGDPEHTLERLTKVVAGQDEETTVVIERVYAEIIDAGVHRVSSIQVAEAAKVIENTQRDLNIALMNEFALICDRIGIRTSEVLEAAATKWNFLDFKPGLVGGHCIGVDPYYLTTKAEELGYNPQVILAGRRINDGMGTFVAQKLVKLLAAAGTPATGARVALLGLTFKQDVSDVRASRVPDIVAELRQFGIEPLVHDPLADADVAKSAFDIELCAPDGLTELDALVYAVPHSAFRAKSPQELLAGVRPGGVVIDVGSALAPGEVTALGFTYWSL